jgi:hypothetical protein
MRRSEVRIFLSAPFNLDSYVVFAAFQLLAPETCRGLTDACYFNLKVHAYPYQPSAAAMTIALCGLL